MGRYFRVAGLAIHPRGRWAWPSGIVWRCHCRYPAGVNARKDQHETAWQAAIDYGIDVSLLEENLKLTPDERLTQLVAMQRFYDAVRAERAEPPRGEQ